MKATIVIVIGLAFFAAPSMALERPRAIEAAPRIIAKELSNTSAQGEWIKLCITELRYVTTGGPYAVRGFADAPSTNGYFFNIGKSGITLTPSSTPVLPLASERFDAPDLPDVWSFLREAAEEGEWVQFWAWPADAEGVRSVTQIRRQYPDTETADCPT